MLKTTMATSLFSSNLVTRGLAVYSDSGITLTDSAYGKLAELQRNYRKRLPPKSQSGVEKNIKWSGKSLITLTELVAEALAKNANLGEKHLQFNIYKEFRRLGHQATLGQICSAINRIFSNCTSIADVWERSRNHSSYGEAWKALPQVEKDRIKQLRRAAVQEYWANMTPEERCERKKTVRTKQQSLLPAEINGKIFKDSTDLKDLEEGNLPGQSFNYQGVPEKMRSSWEGLYGRVILNQPDRVYFYEPMGFPIIIPGTNKVCAYHPDFFDFKVRPDGTNFGKIVEIKGYLTETGQAKIKAFRQLYIEGDLSGLTEQQAKLMSRLISENKRLALEQFGLRIKKTTPFKVYGEQRWDYKGENFIADLVQTGFIPRLKARFPDFITSTPEGALGRKKAREIAQKISPDEKLKQVAPSGSRSFIQRSTYYSYNVNYHTNLYLRSRIFAAAATYAFVDFVGVSLNPKEILPVFPPLPVIGHLMGKWHLDKPKERAEILKEVKECMEGNQYFAAKLGIGYLELVLRNMEIDISDPKFNGLSRSDIRYYAQMKENILDMIGEFTKIHNATKKQIQERLLEVFEEQDEIYEGLLETTVAKFSLYWSILMRSPTQYGKLFGLDTDFIIHQFKNPPEGVHNDYQILSSRDAEPSRYAFDMSIRPFAFIAAEFIYPLKDIPDLPTNLKKAKGFIHEGVKEVPTHQLFAEELEKYSRK